MKEQIIKAIGGIAVAALVYFGYNAFFVDSPAEFSQKYTQGIIELNYTGETDNYTKTTNITKEAAEAIYKENIEFESTYFIQLYQLTDLTEAQELEINSLISEVLEKTKFEVAEGKEISKTSYDVELKVTATKFVEQIDDKIATALEEVDSITIEEFIEIFKDVAKNTEFYDEKTYTITVNIDSSNVYSISDADLMEIRNAVIDYNL